MAPVATTFFFYFLSALTVLSGVLVITRKNAVHSALALIVSLLGQAGAVPDAVRARSSPACRSFFTRAASWCCFCS